MNDYRSKKKVGVRESPARFLSTRIPVEDHEYVDGAEARVTLGRIWRRHSQGDVIRPAYPGKETMGDA